MLKKKGGERMKDVNRMFALCTPEWMVEDGETKAEENAIVLAIVENLRTCLKGLPNELTQNQKRIAFERAVKLFKAESCFNVPNATDFGLGLGFGFALPTPCCGKSE